MSAATPAREQFRPNAPSRLARLGASRVAIELASFFRSFDQVFFTFLLPVLFVVVFSTVFSGDIPGPPGKGTVPFAQYFVPGMIASGVMSAGFAGLAIGIAIEQHDGLLRRLSATPLPRTAYFIGKVGLAVTTAVLMVAIILAIGTAFYGVSPPSDPGRWAAFVAVLVLGVGSCSLLGIAYTRLIRSSTAAPAVVQPPYLVLQFISGVFIQYSSVPGWLKAVASIFPLKWMAQGFRYVFLPDWVAEVDYGGEWDIGLVLAVLAAWFVGAGLLARLAFRWDRSRG